MERESIKQKFKRFIAGISFKVFLWSIDKTDEQYWYEIYEQEKRHLETHPKESK